MDRFFFDYAFLPSGWAADVAADIAEGVIVSVQPNAQPDGRTRLGGWTLPGMPNLHSHAFQRAMAGLAERRGPEGDSFWTWREVMYRFLGRLTPDDVEAIAAFAYAEMLERGFTSVAEFHYLHHDEHGRPYADLAEMSGRIASAAASAGIGLTLLPCFYANSGFGGAAPAHGQRRFVNEPEQFLRLAEELQASGCRAAGRPDRGGAALAPCCHPSKPSGSLGGVPDGPIHIHAAEQTREVDDCLAWSGRRPVQWLLDEMEVDRRWCLIHATHMLPEETAALAGSGAVVGLCPLTEASLGDGICPGLHYARSGGRYGIGTDSNVEITAAGELKQFEYGQRLAHRGRNLLAGGEGRSTGEALYRAALAGGAQASGRRIGEISPGCRADFVVLDGDHPDLEGIPPDLVLDRYVFVASCRAVQTVLVGGKLVVENGRHVEAGRIGARYRKTLPPLLRT